LELEETHFNNRSEFFELHRSMHMAKLLVVDFGPNLDQIPGAAKFFQSLRDSRVVPVPLKSLGDNPVSTAISQGNEIVGFAGDSATSNITQAAKVAKAGGVILAFGDGALASWCKSSPVDGPERSAWLQFFDFGDATKLHAFQQRIGGN
jgi:hypothetical protein